MIDSNKIKNLAYQVGFDLCGICSPDIIPEARERYYRWLENRYHAELAYLAKSPERRSDPRLLLEGANSVIMLGVNYYQPNTPAAPANHGRVARYARGRDYHKVIAKWTKELLQLLRRESAEPTPSESTFRWFVDYGPMLERAYAEKAGLGYIGRNGLLISRRFGSWIFLSEIITTLVLLPDDPKAVKHGTCGTCKKCIDACPTGAIVEDRVVDSSKCISYLTIERPSHVPDDLTANIGDRIFGCDVCQEVCPHNFQRQNLTRHDQFLAGGVGEFIDTRRVMAMQSREDFLNLAAGTPLTRTKLAGLQRSAEWVAKENRR